MSSVYVVALLVTALGAVICVLGAVFWRGRRKKSLGWVVLLLMAAIASGVAFHYASEGEAIEAGFEGYGDRRHANDAGYTDPEAWAKVREERQATQRAEAKAAAAAKGEEDRAVEELASYVAKVTHDLPNRFNDYGIMVPEDERMQPLADDVMAYARFYWTVDSIETNCQFLGQRTNIQILSRDNGVGSWVATVSMSRDHPNYPEYFSLYEKFQMAVSKLGEAVVCPAMYRLLGPNGRLMEDALDINGLIDPEVLYQYKVRVEDGVLWSSKDYCDRRYYLEQGQQQMHDVACDEAKEQDF